MDRAILYILLSLVLVVLGLPLAIFGYEQALTFRSCYQYTDLAVGDSCIPVYSLGILAILIGGLVSSIGANGLVRKLFHIQINQGLYFLGILVIILGALTQVDSVIVGTFVMMVGLFFAFTSARRPNESLAEKLGVRS